MRLPGSTLVCCFPWIVLFGILFSWNGVQRYRNGTHFLPVHVRIDAPEKLREGFIVETRSQWGTLGRLERSEEETGLWKAPAGQSGVNAVLIRSREFLSPGQLRIEVFAGRSLRPPAVHLSLRKISVLEDEAGGEHRYCIEIRPGPLAESRVPVARGTINWQGDFMFLASVSAASLNFTLLALLFWLAIRRLRGRPAAGACGSDAFSSGGSGGILTLSVSMAGATLFAVFLQHLLANRWTGFGIGFALEDIAATALIWSVVAVAAAWVVFVRRISSPGLSDCAALFFLAVVLGLKWLWVAFLNTPPSGDFGLYWEFGKAVAAGRWEELANPSDPLRTLLVQRSIPFHFPAAFLSGGALEPVTWFSALIQVAGYGVFYVFCRTVFYPKVALLGMPFLVVYPEDWYSPTTLSHDLPALFWLMVFWLLFEVLRRRLPHLVAKAGGGGFAGWCLAVGLAFALGLTAVLLEWQRSYGTLLIGGFAIYLALQGLRMFSRKPTGLPRGVPGATVLLVAIAFATYSGINRISMSVLGGHLGSLNPPLSTAAYLTASKTTGANSWCEMQPWRFLYFPAVPGEHRGELFLRKLSHDKLECGAALVAQMYRKNGGYAMNNGSMLGAMGSHEGRWLSSADDVPWLVLQEKACLAFSFFLVGGLLLRLLFLRPHPFASGEVFPLCFCVFAWGMLLFFLENPFYYDRFMVFPMAWSCGLVLDRLLMPPARGHPEASGRRRNPRCHWLSLGTAGCAVLILIHHGLGTMKARFAPAFLKPLVVGNSAVANVRNEDPASGWIRPDIRERPHGVSISFATDPGESIRSGKWTSVGLRVPDCGENLSFFLSLDQLERTVPRETSFSWEAAPLEAVVRIGGEEIFRGPVGDLRKPLFLTHRGMMGRVPAEALELRLSLHAKNDFFPRDFVDAPGDPRLRPEPLRVAVEYFH